MQGQKKGFKHTEETKRKISECSKRFWKDSRYVNKVMEARKKTKEKLGYINSPKTREKLSKIMKDKIKNGEWDVKKYSPYILGHKNGMTGKKHNNKTKRKMSLSNKTPSGIDNRMWLGGKSFEPYDSRFNTKFKNLIRKRDNQVCMLCDKHREKLNKALHIHHLNYDKLLSIPQNCLSLCNSCHAKTNHKRKYWISFFQSILSDKYGYDYLENKDIILEVENGS